MMMKLQEGGYGWMVVLGRFTITFLHSGLHKSLGVLLPNLALHFSADLAELGFCAGVFGGLTNLLGPICIILLQYTSPRRLIIIGSFIASMSLLFTALFVKNYVQLLVAFTFAGIGQGLCGVPCILPVTWYFRKRFALANGISVVGGSLGIMILPLLTQHFIDKYGLRGAILLLSAMSFNGCLAGALMRKPEQKQETVAINNSQQSNYQRTSNFQKGHTEGGSDSNVNNSRDSDVNKSSDSNVNNSCSPLTFIKRCLSHFNADLFSPKFTIYQAIFVLASIGFTTWIVYLVPNAINKNILPNKAVFLSTIGGFGTIIGRVGHAPLVDYDIISSARLYAILSFILGITFLLDPLTDSLTVMGVLALIAGVPIGAGYPISILMTKSLVHEDHFVSAMGWTHFFTGLGKTIGGPLTGWLADSTGAYHIAFWIVGGIDMVIAGILVAIEIFPMFRKESVIPFVRMK